MRDLRRKSVTIGAPVRRLGRYISDHHSEVRATITAAHRPAGVNDLAFRRGTLALRWALFVAYVGLASWGVLDVSGRALLISASLHFAYNLYHTAIEISGVTITPPIFTLNRHLDPVIATITLVALHDVRSPIWAAYFLGITLLSHLLSRREMLEHVGWVTLNYVAFAAIIGVNGTEVSWAYVGVVATLMGFMGVSASLLAGGEERLR